MRCFFFLVVSHIIHKYMVQYLLHDMIGCIAAF